MSTVSAQWREQTLCKAQSFGGVRRLSIRCLSLLFLEGGLGHGVVKKTGSTRYNREKTRLVGSKWTSVEQQREGHMQYRVILESKGSPKEKNSTGNS